MGRLGTWVVAGFALWMTGCMGRVEPPLAAATATAGLALADAPPDASPDKGPEDKGPIGDSGPWGHLTGRFVYDGDPPKRALIQTGGKDVEGPLLDDTFIVDPQSRGVANVVIYVLTRDVKIHPELAKPTKRVQMVTRGFRYEPHVLLAQVGQEVAFPNEDGVGHNAHYSQPGDERFQPQLRKEGETEKLVRSDSFPHPVSCNVHPWMRAYILVRPNPYAAVSGKDGSFRIPHLPAGDLEFQVWHEVKGYLQAKPEWQRGRFKLRIAAGQVNDLGDIKLAPALFER